MNHRGAPIAAVAVVAALAVSGCGGSSPSPNRSPASAVRSAPSPTAGGSATSGTTPQVSSSFAQPSPAVLVIHIRGFAYHPPTPVVVVGQRIRIVNDDTAAHTWSAAPAAGWQYTSGNLEKGQQATFAGFKKPGKYAFLCYYHAEMPAMNGTITVTAAK